MGHGQKIGVVQNEFGSVLIEDKLVPFKWNDVKGLSVLPSVQRPGRRASQAGGKVNTCWRQHRGGSIAIGQPSYRVLGPF